MLTRAAQLPLIQAKFALQEANRGDRWREYVRGNAVSENSCSFLAMLSKSAWSMAVATTGARSRLVGRRQMEMFQRLLVRLTSVLWALFCASLIRIVQFVVWEVELIIFGAISSLQKTNLPFIIISKFVVVRIEPGMS